MGSGESSSNGVIPMNISKLLVQWSPQSPLPIVSFQGNLEKSPSNGAIPMKFSKLRAPLGSAESPSSGVIAMEIGKLVMPLGPCTGATPIEIQEISRSKEARRVPLRRRQSDEN